MLITLDQGLSSASNLAVALLAMNVLEPADFGRFALILLTYAFALGPTRAVVSLPVLVHPEDAERRAWAVLGSALVLDVWAGAICLAVGGLLALGGSSLAPAMLALGLLLPLLQLHDVARYLAIARATPGRAILLDATWLVLMLGAFAYLLTRDLVGLVPFVLGWGGSGAIAALWILVLFGLPRLADISLAWLRTRWDYSWRSLIGNMTNMGSALVGASLISLVSSPVAVAAVRAGLLLGRPSSTVQAAVSSATAVEVARDQPDNAGLRHYQWRAMRVSLLVAVANLLLLVFLPESVGSLVLGNMWPVIAPLLLAIGLVVVAEAAQGGVRAALLGRRQIRTTMVADIVGSIASITSLVIGAAVGGTTGAVWGLVGGQVCTAICWWTAYLLHLHRSATAAVTSPVAQED